MPLALGHTAFLFLFFFFFFFFFFYYRYSAGNLEASKGELAQELKIRLINLGPSFVKFGQALSTRPDVTPPEFIEVLSSLQDKLPSFPDDTARALIESELGKPIDSIFSEISSEPVAAASLGQVYKGKLISGEEVAIKVQRPNIVEGISIDMLLLRRLTQWVEITAPKIYWEATSKRVLTMEWINGPPPPSPPQPSLSEIDFVNMGVQCTLRQLLEEGFFHADPHPGNLLLRLLLLLLLLLLPLLCYGVCMHVCVHLVNRDYDAMCEDYYDLDFMSPEVDTKPIAPALANFFDDALGYSVSELNFGALIDGLGEVFFEYPFQLPPYYALIIRSLSFLEGLAIQTDPEYKLLAASYPYIAQRLLTDRSPELRSSLEELILQKGRIRWGR
eukprot:jgi/Bigna1/38671/e_gw1.27.89.1